LRESEGQRQQSAQGLPTPSSVGRARLRNSHCHYTQAQAAEQASERELKLLELGRSSFDLLHIFEKHRTDALFYGGFIKDYILFKSPKTSITKKLNVKGASL
jgi:hypothetical protein